MDFNEDTTYVLTATRTRATWKEPIGNSAAMRTKSIRFRRGDKLLGIPIEQVARLVDLGHAVPEDEYDPEAIQRLSAARRLAMTQAAAADAKAAVLAAQQASGQPVAGLPDADVRMVDGIEVEDVDGLKDDGGEDDDLAKVPAPDYGSMDYPTLQRTAKERGLNAGGSADELRARLREADEQ